MLLLDRALDVHAEIPDEVWDPTFKNAQEKAKWQELQLVSTLIGFAAAAAALEDQFDSRMEEALTTINMRSGGWKRPEKTQTKEQWKFIAGVVAAQTAQDHASQGQKQRQQHCRHQPLPVALHEVQYR